MGGCEGGRTGEERKRGEAPALSLQNEDPPPHHGWGKSKNKNKQKTNKTPDQGPNHEQLWIPYTGSIVI
eukprot:7201642-Pyramimonas_sp.AAC.1